MVHQGWDKSLGEASSSMMLRKLSDEDLADVLDRAQKAIILSLDDGVLTEVSNEKTAAKL